MSLALSRRDVLKMGSLLTIGGILAPAMAIFPDVQSQPNDFDGLLSNHQSLGRSDIRSLDFESHNFLLNFQR